MLADPSTLHDPVFADNVLLDMPLDERAEAINVALTPTDPPRIHTFAVHALPAARR